MREKMDEHNKKKQFKTPTSSRLIRPCSGPLKKPAKQQRTLEHRWLFIKTVELLCNLLKRKCPKNRGEIMFEGPEKKFQRHIADYFIREYQYALIEQDEITDTEYYFAEDHLIAFLNATQKETFENLEAEYGTDAEEEIFKALKDELRISPLWLIIRHGLTVRGLEFKLYFPKPRSNESVANQHYRENRITFIPELVIKGGERPDFGLFLNGLPTMTMELKHEKNQTVHDAVRQYADRDHDDRIFQLPFLHIAADTSDVMVATDPRAEKNFRWYNTGLENKTENENQYPVEFLYSDVLAKETILEAISFFLIYVPKKEAERDKPERPAFTIFPRYHQSRMVHKVAQDVLGHFTEQANIGKKYLIAYSAGSGKTLSICWLADRLHSLYKPGTNEKMLDMLFVLTDRKSLDKNIRDEFENLTHLQGVAGYAKKSAQLKQFLKTGRSIVVSTQQKFKWILDEIADDSDLKQLRVAFLIDEAIAPRKGKWGLPSGCLFAIPMNRTATQQTPKPTPKRNLPRLSAPTTPISSLSPLRPPRHLPPCNFLASLLTPIPRPRQFKKDTLWIWPPVLFPIKPFITCIAP
ncbi:Type I restriction-modification system, restriction subunit R (EC [Olavius sp. associated proteobacterium Delta 1]|nr:Type I restriction-modification system, restriction subunit R (EC [Olavius sp. associated proteobacterium Delta 1]